MKLEIFITSNLQLLKVGGAITGNSDQIATKYFNNRKILGRTRNVVVISSHLKEKLTLQEYKAIYYHEEGHHVLRHTGNNSVAWQAKELEADAYAIKYVSAKNLLMALIKIPAIIRTNEHLKNHILKTKSIDEYNLFISKFLNEVNDKMQFRYKALQKEILKI